MIFDKELMFSEEQDLSQAAGDYASTNVIDLGVAKIGKGEPLRIFCQAIEAFKGPGATVTFALQTDDNESFSTPTTIHTSGAIGVATLVAGYRSIDLPLPSNTERYVRLYYTIASAATTSGTVTAGLIKDEQTNE